ncbi:MAG: potassium transporter TrkA [Myxococcales bacterium SG8_38]|nr:MAG: potassium transporter TrkA [Myxococcales bacterium SG8_38]
MSIEAWIATGVVVAVFGVLGSGRYPPYLVLLGGVAVLLAGGIIDTGEALAGFSNSGVITVGVLYVVAAGLKQSGALAFLTSRVLGRPRTVRGAQARLLFPVTIGSAFLNNTPLVAMLLPVLMDWSRSTGIPASKLLLPLSYAAILGGVCTLIGTSTTLVVHGLLLAEGKPGLEMFEIAWVGLPCAVLGSALLMWMARRWLPAYESVLRIPEDPREYTVEMRVAPRGPLVGKSIENAGLRHLPGLYLMEIHRGGHVVPVVDPAERLDAGDQLVFVGVVHSVVDLQQIPGLEPTTEQVFKLDSHRSQRCFAEAVVSRTHPLVGKTIREGRFRNLYNAVVIAVSRNGERVQGRIGDIELHAGDSLLLEALPSFVEQHRNSSDYYLVSRLGDAGPPTTAQAPVAMLILATMVTVVAIGWLGMLQAALLAAGAMLMTRCVSEDTARRSIDWPLLVAIGSSFGLGNALYETGAAASLAGALLDQAGNHPWLALAAIYATTTIISEFVTNNAAAVIVFPIAMATATTLQVNYMPFVIAVAVAASASFASPLGYQTHLMVFGPGNYRLRDFVRMGIPMNLLLWIITTGLAPFVWPF